MQWRDTPDLGEGLDSLDICQKQVGCVAHDINNMLTIITAQLEMLKLGLDEPKLHEELEPIEEATEAIRALTERLATMHHYAPPSPEGPVDIAEAVQRAAALAKPVLGEKVSLQVETHDPLSAAPVEESDLIQAVVNLILNARDAMPSGGVVTLRARMEQEAVVIEVQDTGKGMSPAVQSVIFQPEFTTKRSGSGLGLSAVTRVVGQCGGRVHVDSKEGEGTRFSLILPESLPVLPG